MCVHFHPSLTNTFSESITDSTALLFPSSQQSQATSQLFFSLMVSVLVNPLERGGGGGGGGGGEGGVFYFDQSMEMNDGVTSTTLNTDSSDDPSKKIRKPYTITKSRESWTDQEHDKFLEALQLFDRDWKKIEAFVGSKTVIQIRSHAQKYFLKVQKSGTTEHLPPPRPKRKAAHPYPQKATKNSPVLSQMTGLFQSSSAPLESGYVLRPDSSSTLRSSSTGGPTISSWAHNNSPPAGVSQTAKGEMGARPAVVNNCFSKAENTPSTCPTFQNNDQGNHGPPLRVPDFAQVYSFIGGVFDPDTSDHFQKLKEMDPIDVETVLLLMRNLTMNLSSPDFEDHRKLLSSYEIDSEKE